MRKHIDYIPAADIRPTSPEWRWMHGTAEDAAAVEALAAEAAAMVAQHWTAVSGGDAGRPTEYRGSVPAPSHTETIAAAAAPRYERHAAIAPVFTTRHHETAPDGRVTMAELRSRATAAARQVTRGSQWRDDQREDITGAVVETVLRRTNWTGTRHGTPRDVLRWIDFAETYPLEAARRERANIGTVPKAAASGLVLLRHALDARDTVGVRTVEDDDWSFSDDILSDAPGAQLRRTRDLLSTPRNARLTAVHMLADLDLPTEWGPCFTVAYTAARGVLARAEDGTITEASGDDIASELDMTHTAYRKAMSRGRKHIRETVHGHRWMVASLHLLDPLAGTGATFAASLGHREQWRETPRTVADIDYTRTRVRPRRTPASWTADLPERTRNRLHAAAVARQERAGMAPEHRTRATV